jgi:toxin ParE1/3/4
MAGPAGKRLTILWSTQAASELKAIPETDRQPEMANGIRRAIYERVQSLRSLPYLASPGRVENTRELVVTGTPYLVVYRVSEDGIVILNVLPGARNLA